MSTAFINALRTEYPSADIDVIVKKGLESLISFIPGINRQYIFSKNDWKGLRDVYRFGKRISKEVKYDLFFCLPDSFSSALMGWSIGARQRIGFKKEFRSMFLTGSFQKPSSLHRVDQYVSLLEQFANKKILSRSVLLKTKTVNASDVIIINFNSEAESRRMPVAKGASILNALIEAMPTRQFVCIGSVKDKDHVDAILKLVPRASAVSNKGGETPALSDLIELIASGTAILTTDSGPAHIANALGIPAVVTFGAGDENSTAPYNKDRLVVLRLGQLPCEPCVKNTCKFGLPKCLEQLEVARIVDSVKNFVAS
jgi:lipopolysaccharide heptosyltransferase II